MPVPSRSAISRSGAGGLQEFVQRQPSVAVPIQAPEHRVAAGAQVLEVRADELVRRHRAAFAGDLHEMGGQGAVELVVGDLAVVVEVELVQKAVGHAAGGVFGAGAGHVRRRRGFHLGDGRARANHRGGTAKQRISYGMSHGSIPLG